MEIVKQLGKSENEEHKEDFNFDFKEHYLKEDEKSRRAPNRLIPIILAITTIFILGYIAFNIFQTENLAVAKTSNIKDIVISTIKVQKKEAKKITLYTEVLALEHLAPVTPKVNVKETKRIVIIKKGDSLAYISKKFYGNINEVKKIVNANSNIKSAKSTLRIGQKVYVPR